MEWEFLTFQLNLSEMSNLCSCGYSVSYSFILEPVRKYLNGFSYNCLGEFTIYDWALEAKDVTCSVRKERERKGGREGREGGRQSGSLSSINAEPRLKKKHGKYELICVLGLRSAIAWDWTDTPMSDVWVSGETDDGPAWLPSTTLVIPTTQYANSLQLYS